MVDVSWIKLKLNMFDDERIKLIESMPEADSILIIWIRLLSQAGKTNANGYIFLNENVPYTPEMLSTLFNRPLNTVRLALTTLAQFEMIEVENNGFIRISNWEKHQNVDGLDKIREQNRIKMQKYRASKKNNKLGCNVTSNVTVTERNAIDIDKELDTDLELEKEYEHTPEKITSSFTIPTQQEVEDYFEGQLFPREWGTVFWANYDSIGWIDGQGRNIKNWKSRVPMWANNQKQFGDKKNGTDQSNSKGSVKSRLDYKPDFKDWNKRIEELKLITGES